MQKNSDIASATTNDSTMKLGFGLTNLDATIHKKNETHQGISKNLVCQTSQIIVSAKA